jgi:hypothetical protein
MMIIHGLLFVLIVFEC